MAKHLQILRNKTISTDREAAKTALTTKLATLNDGEVALNRYQNGDDVKVLVGFNSVGDSETKQYIFDADAIPSDVQTELNKIDDYVGKTDIPTDKTVMSVIVDNEKTTADAIKALAKATGIIDSDDNIAFTAPSVSGMFSTTKSVSDMLKRIDSTWNTIDCGTYVAQTAPR